MMTANKSNRITEFIRKKTEEKDTGCINNLHELLGHPCKAITYKTAKAMNIRLAGHF